MVHFRVPGLGHSQRGFHGHLLSPILISKICNTAHIDVLSTVDPVRGLSEIKSTFDLAATED